MAQLNTESKPVSYIGVLILSIASFGLLGLASGQVHSFDVFWQLQSGKYILQTKDFIYQDLFSLAAEVPRYEHCWLHDVIFYTIYKISGYTGISLFKGLIVSLTAGLRVLIARQRGSSWLSISVLIPTFFLSTFWAWKERPQLWTYLFFTLFLLVLERHKRRGDRVIFLLLPAMAVWSNLHAGAILAFPIVAVYLVWQVWQQFSKNVSGGKSQTRSLLLFTGLLPLCALVTPYSTEILTTLVQAPFYGVSSGMERQIFNIDSYPTTIEGYPKYFVAMFFALSLMVLGGGEKEPA